MKTIRIFISSPGDVSEEREKARLVIADLQRRYDEQATLLPVLWEDLAIPATASFQEGIDLVLADQHRIDIAVFILWSRMGSPLRDVIKKPDGSCYLSGTEREFDLMLAAFQQSGSKMPIILAYTRQDEEGFNNNLDATKKGDDTLEELLKQRKLVKQFIREHFQDSEGRNLRAYHCYREPVGFAQRLHVHLRGAIDDFLNIDASTPCWTESPYRGLLAFDMHHAPIFCGRDEETCDILQRLRDQERQGCAFVCVVGASGAGKSSLVRAGVAATMQQRSFDERIKEWRVAALVPSHSQGDLALHLARTLADVLPTLREVPGELDEFTACLREHNLKASSLLFSMALERHHNMGSSAGHGGSGRMKILLILDQMEELWTDHHLLSSTQREQFLQVIESLITNGHISVIATLRSDFYPNAQLSPTFLRMKGERGHFDLTPPGPAAIRQMIVLPATRSGLRFEHDVESGRSLELRVMEDAVRDASSLPLLQYALTELYDRRDLEKNLLTNAGYEAMGRVEGALGQRAEQVFAALSLEAKNSLEDILPHLIAIGTTDDQNAVRRRTPLADIIRSLPQKELVEGLVAARFLTTDQVEGVAVISLAHEALLRKWERISRWITQNRELLLKRSRIEQSLAAWQESGQHVSRLLQDGLPIQEGEVLLHAGGHLLNERVKTFISASIMRNEQIRRRNARHRSQVLAALSLLSVLALASAGMAWKRSLESDANAAKHRKAEKIAVAASARAELDRKKAEAQKLRADENEQEVKKKNSQLEMSNAELKRTLAEKDQLVLEKTKANQALDKQVNAKDAALRKASTMAFDAFVATYTFDEKKSYIREERIGRKVGVNYLEKALEFDPRNIAALSTSAVVNVAGAGQRVPARFLLRHGPEKMRFTEQGEFLHLIEANESQFVVDTKTGQTTYNDSGKNIDWTNRPSFSKEPVINTQGSPDGKCLVKYGGNAGVVFSEAKSGKTLWELKDFHVESLAFSPLGDRAAVGLRDGRVMMLDLLNQIMEVWYRFPALDNDKDSEGMVADLVFSPDGRFLAAHNIWYSFAGWPEHLVALCDASQPRSRQVLSPHANEANPTWRLSADEKRVNIVSKKQVRSIQLETNGSTTLPLKEPSAALWPFSNRVFVGTKLEDAGLYDLWGEEKMVALTPDLWLTKEQDPSFVFSENGRFLCKLKSDSFVLLDTATGHETKMPGHAVQRYEFAMGNLDGLHLPSAFLSNDGLCLITVQAETGKVSITRTNSRERIDLADSAEVDQLRFAVSHDAKTIAIGNSKQELCIYDGPSGQLRHKRQFSDSEWRELEAFSLSFDGNWLMTPRGYFLETKTLRRNFLKFGIADELTSLQMAPNYVLLGGRHGCALWHTGWQLMSDTLCSEEWRRFLALQSASEVDADGLIVSKTDQQLMQANQALANLDFQQKPLLGTEQQHALLRWLYRAPELRTGDPWSNTLLKDAVWRDCKYSTQTIRLDEVPWHPLTPLLLARSSKKNGTKHPLDFQYLAGLTLKRLKEADEEFYGRLALAEYASWASLVMGEELNLTAQAKEAEQFAKERMNDGIQVVAGREFILDGQNVIDDESLNRFFGFARGTFVDDAQVENGTIELYATGLCENVDIKLLDSKVDVFARKGVHCRVIVKSSSAPIKLKNLPNLAE